MADQAPAPAKSGKKIFVILIPLALLAIGAGAALPWVFGASIAEHSPHEKKGAHAATKKQTAVPFDDVVVNLSEGKVNQYLRVKLMLAVDDAVAREVTELVTQRKPFLKSWLICYLSDQSASEVSRRSGVNRLRREICDHFNTMLYPDSEGKVQDVLFDMFVVQQ